MLPSRRDLRRGAAAGTARTGVLPRMRAGALAVGLAAVGAGLVMGAVPAPPTADAGSAPARAVSAEPLPQVTADSAAAVEFSRQALAAVHVSEPKAKALSTDLNKTEGGPELAAPLDDLAVASTFGYRVNPMGGYAPELHTGIDYAGACGTPVKASDEGVIVDAGWHAYGGGQRIVIDHGDGLKSTYNHLSQIGVATGQTVERGGQIGAVGSTGNSTGCHLHFEVMVNDAKVDPLPWL
jgi:murein DD-endopeptidase MepM/ murein hydrolase activator NlpD